MKTIVEMMFPSQHGLAKKMLYDPERLLMNAVMQGMSSLNLGAAAQAFDSQTTEAKKFRLRRITQGLVDHDRIITCHPRDHGAAVHRIYKP
jgi:hypothetical protein